MIYYPNFMPDFMDQYTANEIASLKAGGLTGTELEAKIKEMEVFNEQYKNPLIMAGITFLEVFPVGLIVALLSAFLLKKKTD